MIRRLRLGRRTSRPWNMCRCGELLALGESRTRGLVVVCGACGYSRRLDGKAAGR